MEGGWGGGVCCLLEVPQGCSCQVNILQCTLEGVKTVVGKHIRWKFVPLGYCSGKKTVFIIVVGGGYLSVFVWVVGSCLAVSGYEVLIGIDVYKIVGYFVQCAKSGLSPPLVQGWPGEGRGQGASRCLPAVIVGHESCKTAFCVTLHMDKVQDEEDAHLLRLTMFSVDMCIMCHIQRDKLCNKSEISVSG